MAVVVFGLNYRTAPVQLREKLTLSGLTLQAAFRELCTYCSCCAADSERTSPSPIDEVVILSTCNRFEFYMSSQQPQQAIRLIESFLVQSRDITLAALRSHRYSYAEDSAVEHLMRVACGLDSMILGESQILGQVTQAFEDAQSAGTTGAVLSHLFAQVIHTGKRSRTETPIGRYTTSVSHAGARLLLERLEQRRDARVLVIGAGEMAVFGAQALKRFGFRDLMFINRTYDKAQSLAKDFNGKCLPWSQLGEALSWADAVVSATGAPHTVIYRNDIEMVLVRRNHRSLVLMDIAVPRDIEAEVDELPDVQVFDIDDLRSVVDNNVALRKASIPQVEAIIQQEMARFLEWYHGRQVTPVIRTLREWAQGVAEEELMQTLNRIPDSDEHTRQIVTLLAHRLVNRLLHQPTARLRMQAHEGNGHGYAHAVKELFALHELSMTECHCDSVDCAPADPDQNQSATPCTLQCILR